MPNDLRVYDVVLNNSEHYQKQTHPHSGLEGNRQAEQESYTPTQQRAGHRNELENTKDRAQKSWIRSVENIKADGRDRTYEQAGSKLGPNVGGHGLADIEQKPPSPALELFIWEKCDRGVGERLRVAQQKERQYRHNDQPREIRYRCDDRTDYRLQYGQR